MYFVTGNKNKFEEANSILGSSFNLKQLDVDLPEIQSLDPKEVIEHKLKEASARHKGKLVVEDLSASINCLNGFPGPLIKWFWEDLGNEGIADLVSKYEDNRVVSTINLGYSDEGGGIKYFDSSLKGKIVAPRVDGGWGWDPIFEEVETGKTFAEMTSKEKNKISMRKIVFEKLKEYLESIS